MTEDNTTSNTRRALAINLFLFLSVFFLLFFALGQRALWGSEDRWGEIARNMRLYGDWFHPIINGEVYFDKPLLSYWLIVLASYCAGGLSEWTVRLPGALSALLTLFCSYKIAQELFGHRVAWLSACLIITSYGFLFWSHTASAELSNLALIMAAVAWFVLRRERTDFSSYLIFYLLCAVGCQLKGLTALVVPLLVLLPHVLRHRTWRSHLNTAHFLALGISLGVFFLPYLGASLHPLPAGIEAQQNHLSGLGLLVRENIVRFFEPFDHVDPFYSYLYELPRILFPWMFLFLAGLFHFGSQYRKLDESHRWLLEAIALIFLFFTFSGSRRWYYILPIMPFCMILSSSYLLAGGGKKVRKLAMQLTHLVLAASAALLLVLPLAIHLYFSGLPIPTDFFVGSALTGIGTVALVLLRKYRANDLLRLIRTDGSLSDQVPFLFLIAAMEMTVIFGFVLPGADSYRQQKPFALSLSRQLTPADQLSFFGATNTSLAYYLNVDHAIPVVHSRSDLSDTGRKWIIITERANLERLFREFPDLRSAIPVLREKQTVGRALLENSGLTAYRLN